MLFRLKKDETCLIGPGSPDINLVRLGSRHDLFNEKLVDFFERHVAIHPLSQPCELTSTSAPSMYQTWIIPPAPPAEVTDGHLSEDCANRLFESAHDRQWQSVKLGRGGKSVGDLRLVKPTA